MVIKKKAIAGTVESSDLLVQIEPGSGGLQVSIQSVVKERFGHLIEATVHGVLKDFGVENATVYIDDRGALDCVIRARVETAIRRGAEEV